MSEDGWDDCWGRHPADFAAAATSPASVGASAGHQQPQPISSRNPLWQRPGAWGTVLSSEQAGTHVSSEDDDADMGDDLCDHGHDEHDRASSSSSSEEADGDDESDAQVMEPEPEDSSSSSSDDDQ
jgi:hypothetical protein